jgi:hypothetical protein
MIPAFELNESTFVPPIPIEIVQALSGQPEDLQFYYDELEPIKTQILTFGLKHETCSSEDHCIRVDNTPYTVDIRAFGVGIPESGLEILFNQNGLLIVRGYNVNATDFTQDSNDIVRYLALNFSEEVCDFRSVTNPGEQDESLGPISTIDVGAWGAINGPIEKFTLRFSCGEERLRNPDNSIS